MSEAPVVIVGAGMAGLTAALTVLEAGRPCVVLEAAQRVGGCCATLDDGARTVEPAASVVIGKEMLADVLDSLAVDIRPLLSPMQPIVSARWTGGRFDLMGPSDALAHSLAGWADADVAAARAFFDRLTEVARDLLPALWQWKTAPPARALATCLPLTPWIRRSYLSVVRGSFTNPRLRFVLQAFSDFYAGLPAAKAPAVLAILPALAITEGCFEVAGGIQRLPELLAERVRARGGVIQTGAPVLRLVVQGDRVAGVETASGITRAGGVVAACDVRRTLALLPSATRLVCSRLYVGALRPSVAVVSVVATEDGDCGLPPISWVIPADPATRTRAARARGTSGLLPMVAVTRGDGAPGTRSLRIGGALGSGPPLSLAESDACANRLLQLVADAGLQLRLRASHVWRPSDYETSLGLPGGNAFGFAPSRWQLGPTRYGPRTPFANLTVAGQSCFPGFGIPLVAFSGKLAATVLTAP